MRKFNAYLAGPIFTYGDLLRNTEWAAKLRAAFPEMDLYSPVENTDINGVEGKKKFADSKMVASADNARLDNTDVLIACIDGDVLPSGTCAEIGKFHEKIARGDKKYIVGICTDNRQCFLTHSDAKDTGGASALGEQQYSYQNIYVTGLIKEYGVLVTNIDEAIQAIRNYLGDVETYRVGDEVFDGECIGIVTCVGDGSIDVVMSDGSADSWGFSEWAKTGRSYPEVVDMLSMLKASYNTLRGDK